MGGYEEVAPPRGLAEHVACLWVRRVQAGEPPDSGLACIDIVWPSGQPPQVAGPDAGPGPFLVSPGTAIVGVRFRPGRAPGGLGMPASQLLDKRVPLDAVWSGAAVRRLQEAGGDRGDKVRQADQLARAEPAGGAGVARLGHGHRLADSLRAYGRLA